MLTDSEIEVVYIATPHGNHYAIATEALHHGKHVLCEKSMTVNADQSRHLDTIARERGLFLMEAMWMKFSPSIRRLRREIADGVIGEVKGVRANFSVNVPPTPESRFWRADAGGGALLDLGVYPVTFAHMLLGRPDRVRATGSITSDGVDLYDEIHFQYDSGRHASLGTSMIEFELPVATVAGTDGYISVDMPFFASPQFTIHTPPFTEPRVVRTEIEGEGYVPMFREASAAVLAGRTRHEWNPMEDTIEILELIDEVRRQLIDAGPVRA
jgi:predicted dehydrogenase